MLLAIFHAWCSDDVRRLVRLGGDVFERCEGARSFGVCCRFRCRPLRHAVEMVAAFAVILLFLCLFHCFLFVYLFIYLLICSCIHLLFSYLLFTMHDALSALPR